MSSVYSGKADEREDDSARHFVNGLTVAITLSSVNFDFRAIGTPGDQADQIWRFTTTPSSFRTFHAKLGKAIDSYRAQFGEISSIDLEDLSDPEAAAMARVGAVHFVGESIVGLLTRRRDLLAEAGTLAPVPAAQDIAHVPVAKLVSSSPPTSGLSLTCYHMARSDHAPPVTSPGARSEKIGISLELHYLLACWSGTASDETALLSWAMMELNRFSTLGGGQLLGDVWERDEVIQLAPGNETPDQLARIWDGFKAKYRLSATYTARVVRLGYGTTPDALPVVASRFSFADGDVAMEQAP